MGSIKHIFKLCFIFIIPCLMICSCTEEKDYVIEEVFGDFDGQLRGVNLGVDLNSVLQAEVKRPKDQQEDYLYYDYIIGDRNSYTVSYSFDDKGLYEIQIDIYLMDNKARAEDLFDKIYLMFRDHFGEVKENDNTLALWNFKNPAGESIEINLINESDEYEYGKLSLTYYNFD